MPTLSQLELDALEALQDVSLESFTTQDAIDYYTYLQNKGFDYATLALGVVQNNTSRGAIANDYAASAAATEGVDFTVGSAAWKEMQFNLMQQDFALRDANSGVDLDFEQYDAAHASALDQVGLPPEVWTAHTPLTLMAETNPTLAAAVWEDLITDTGFFDGWLTEGLYSIGLNAGVPANQTLSEIAGDYADLMQWHGDPVPGECAERSIRKQGFRLGVSARAHCTGRGQRGREGHLQTPGSRCFERRRRTARA